MPESSSATNNTTTTEDAERKAGEEDIEGGGRKDVVFGVLYEMTPEDEYLLDGYEGVDHTAPASVFGAVVPPEVRPREQENGAYNKWYVPARVVWGLQNDDGDEKEEDEGKYVEGDDVTVLLYVDEKRVSLGPPKWEYIARMNRAIAEGVQLGIPRDWVHDVMRRAIPESG